MQEQVSPVTRSSRSKSALLPDDSALDALADSFAFESCRVRASLVDRLRAGWAG